MTRQKSQLKRMPPRRRIRVPAVNPAIRPAYLARKWHDFDWMKTAPEADLRAHANDDLGYRFVTAPRHSQLVCFAIAAALNGFCFFLDKGAGKSKIILDQIRHRKRRGELSRALICVPELLHVETWVDQIREHAPDLTYTLLLGDRERKLSLMHRKSDIAIVNYPGLMTYMSMRRFNPKKKRNEEVIDPTAAAEFAALFNFVAFDESHRLGNHATLYYEMARWLSIAATYKYCLTATPFGRDPAMLWTQFNLVDEGETLGSTLTLFRSVFFEPKEDYWAGVKWDFDPKMRPELTRVIKNKSITYSLDEITDLPPKVSMRIPFTLSDEALHYYTRIVQGVREARGDYRSLESLFTRMRQCCSGFIALKADDSTRIQVQFKVNAKLERLREFVQDKDDKILVYHEFIRSGEMIEDMLREEKIKFASLRGSTKDPGAEYRRFIEDPKCQVFVLQNRLGSEAINPQAVVRRAVFYEAPVSPITRSQAEGRIYRPGQKHTAFIYDLCARGTIEQKVLRYIKEGKDLLKAILSGAETLQDAAQMELEL
jgi:SNF2 family DNA or RNA helicase